MKTRLLFLLFILPLGMMAQTPDWATGVAPIMYANCTKCHNSNGIAPFSLITYTDALNNATSISDAVVNRRMPPWPPDSAYRHLAHERILSAQDIQTISDWVNAGAPSGNLAQAPAPPVYSSSAVLTNPDLAVQMPLYTVNAATDLYRCFVMPTGVTTDEYITKVEVLPGNRSIVHHVLVYQDLANTCINLDNQDPGPGYTSFGSVGSSTATLIAGWVPGQDMWSLPPNMGIKLFANTNIVIQVHYPGGIFNQLDSTSIRFTFASGTVRNVTLNPILNHWSTMTNGPLAIPANTTRTFHEEAVVTLNATVISIAPHMHLIGHTIKSYAVTPNTDTIPLIYIPNWDFHWQGFYNYQQPVHVPFGSHLHAVADYDNTTNNQWNPNNPPVNVYDGEATTDEMMVVYFAYLPYLPGDENIVVDSTVLSTPQPFSPSDYVSTPQLYDPYPVPATDQVTVQYLLPNKTSVLMEVFDVTGKRILVPVNGVDQAEGYQTQDIKTAGWAAGTYTIKLTAGGVTRTKTIVVN